MDETVIKRVMPHDTPAEQSTIGCMLMSKDAIAIAAETLNKDDFYGKQYGILFEAITSLFNEGKAVDPVILNSRLKEMQLPEGIDTQSLLQEVVASVPNSSRVAQYADSVRKNSVLRKLIRVSQTIENSCYASGETLDRILDDTEKMVFDVIKNRSTEDYMPINQVVLNALERINIASLTKGPVTGVATGFTDLDYMTAGLQPSNLVLIAARPSMGKTAFVLNIAEHICFRDNKSVAMFSLEMSREELVNRLLSLESKVNSQNLRTGDLNERDWVCLAEAAGVVAKSKLIIDDTSSITLSELRSKCRKYKLEHDIQVVIIDYLQLMSGSGRADSRVNEISEISRGLKSLARELKVPVVALSQLSRGPEQRQDHRPILSDLRESGAIEQDADVVMFLYREDYYERDREATNIAEVIVAKQRNGPLGKVDLVWMPDYTKFANKARNEN
ncbi:MAG: replicative DNA helicase [Lachnospiraceae bacterium]|nr:replicative DNA helicase [Lachnospiraceae bacterium]